MGSAQDIIDAILYSASHRPGSHFSSTVYADEPIITTGRQMKSYVPERIRQMKEISRYTEGRDGRPGHWLSETQYFYLQGTFMADYEDDYPYTGSFKGYYPTYNDMSDRQLRGYFSWRTQVRRGRVEEAPVAFAFMYLYELICGIGVESPLDGFRKIQGFIEAYRGFAPEIGRFGDTWLADYAIYHGLDPELLAGTRTVAFDRSLAALESAGARAKAQAPVRRTKNAPPTIPLPADVALEDELFDALAELSTYRVKASRMYKAHPEGFRHVTCAVYVRLSIYYERQRKKGLIESWFGEKLELPYTMFGSAVFFDPEPHADTVYRLDEETTFRCTDRSWTCERHQGARNRNGKLGQVLRAVDRKLREAYDFPYPLKDDGKTPKYLDQFIDQEIEVWRTWEEAHAPREVRIDLGQLSDIRSAAAKTREALLTDEERGEDADIEGDGGRIAGAKETDTGRAYVGAGAGATARGGWRGNEGAGTAVEEVVNSHEATAGAAVPMDVAGTPPLFGPEFEDGGAARGAGDRTANRTPAAATDSQRADIQTEEATEGVVADISVPTGAATAASAAAGEQAGSGPLDGPQAAYLRCLLEGAPPEERGRAVAASGLSEDMLVDAINEALFDAVGDTVIEFGPAGPELIEDYREDVREVLGDE